jgi:hypothetical protein
MSLRAACGVAIQNLELYCMSFVIPAQAGIQNIILHIKNEMMKQF